MGAPPLSPAQWNEMSDLDYDCWCCVWDRCSPPQRHRLLVGWQLRAPDARRAYLDGALASRSTSLLSHGHPRRNGVPEAQWAQMDARERARQYDAWRAARAAHDARVAAPFAARPRARALLARRQCVRHAVDQAPPVDAAPATPPAHLVAHLPAQWWARPPGDGHGAPFDTVYAAVYDAPYDALDDALDDAPPAGPSSAPCGAPEPAAPADVTAIEASGLVADGRLVELLDELHDKIVAGGHEPVALAQICAAARAMARAARPREECVCAERLVDCVLSPCGHTMCTKCARRMEQCPFCRRAVVSALEFYM